MVMMTLMLGLCSLLAGDPCLVWPVAVAMALAAAPASLLGTRCSYDAGASTVRPLSTRSA